MYINVNQSFFCHELNTIKKKVIVKILVQVEQAVHKGFIFASPLSYRQIALSPIAVITKVGSGAPIDNLKAFLVIQFNSNPVSFFGVFVQVEHKCFLMINCTHDYIFIDLLVILILIYPSKAPPFRIVILVFHCKSFEGGIVLAFGGDHKIMAKPRNILFEFDQVFVGGELKEKSPKKLAFLCN